MGDALPSGGVVLSGRAWATTSLPQMYFVPRTNALRRVLIHDVDRLRVLRTELELLKRVNRFVRRAGPWRLDVPDVARRFTPEDKAELADILRTARRPIVREMIAVIDDEFPELRKEIMMSVVNEEAQQIAEDAQAAGVAGEAPAEQATAPAAEDVTPTPTLEDIDATLAAAQNELASLVDDTSATDPKATPADAAPANEAPSEVPPNDAPPADSAAVAAVPSDYTRTEVPTAEATPADEAPSNDVSADVPEVATVTADAPDTATCAAAEVDTFADGEGPTVDDACPSTPAASQAGTETAEAAAETDVVEQPEVATVNNGTPEPAAPASETVTAAPDGSAVDDASEATAFTSCDESAEAPSAGCAEPTVETNVGSADCEPSCHIQDISMDEPAYPNSVSTEAPTASLKEDAASTGEPAAAPTETVDILDPDHSPERVERTVAEIEQGIRKLAAVLSGEVNDQWKLAQKALSEVAESREAIAQAGRDAEPILAELKRVSEETKQTQETLKIAAQEAKAFREETRRAKERAETSAAAAELAAEQVVREVENARAASCG